MKVIILRYDSTSDGKGWVVCRGARLDDDCDCPVIFDVFKDYITAREEAINLAVRERKMVVLIHDSGDEETIFDPLDEREVK